MDYKDSVRLLRGRVRTLLTQVDQAGKRKRPLEVYSNSRIYQELQQALYLVEGTDHHREAYVAAQESNGQ